MIYYTAESGFYQVGFPDFPYDFVSIAQTKTIYSIQKPKTGGLPKDNPPVFIQLREQNDQELGNQNHSDQRYGICGIRYSTP